MHQLLHFQVRILKTRTKLASTIGMGNISLPLPTLPLSSHFVPAPTMSPTIHYAHGINATSIQFNLSSPRPYYAAYNITGYLVRYWKSLEDVARARRSFAEDSSAANVTFPPGSITAILTGLEAYTEYCLSAQVTNVFGAGPFGPCTTAMSGESGNAFNIFVQMC